jgi:hypothetical protein
MQPTEKHPADIDLWFSSSYRWPDGPGPMGWHEHDSKKHDTRTVRHEEDSASGWPGPMVGPGLSRTLGTVARHGHDTIFGSARCSPTATTDPHINKHKP